MATVIPSLDDHIAAPLNEGSTTGLRDGTCMVDKRTELGWHRVYLVEDQETEVAITGNTEQAFMIAVLDLEKELKFGPPGGLIPRQAGVYRIDAVLEVTGDFLSNCTVRLRIGPVTLGNIAIIKTILTGAGTGAFYHLHGTLFLRPDTGTLGDLRASFSGVITDSDGSTVVWGENGPDDPIHEQAWDALGPAFITLTAQFAAADASEITIRQAAIERVF